MTKLSDIYWGKYGNYEGPMYAGTVKCTLPNNPTFEDKLLCVISSSEANGDGINMYDSGIISVGFIQWIEGGGQFNVSNMLGVVYETCGKEYFMKHMAGVLTMANATFKQNESGKWRFYITKGETAVEVNTTALARELYLSCSGKKGGWTGVSKIYAKNWAASISNLMKSDCAISAQKKFTFPKLISGYVLKNGRSILFNDNSPLSTTNYANAIKSLYVAYSVNRPTTADKVLQSAVSKSNFPKWSKQWCYDIAYEFVANSGIKIWPDRYAYKVKTLNSIFNVDYPQKKQLLTKFWYDSSPEFDEITILEQQNEQRDNTDDKTNNSVVDNVGSDLDIHTVADVDTYVNTPTEPQESESDQLVDEKKPILKNTSGGILNFLSMLFFPIVKLILYIFKK